MTEVGSWPLLTKAQESVEAARYLLDGGYIEIAVTRAYYAQFYCAQALLMEAGVEGSSHKRVISAFGQFLVHEGEAPESLHRYLIEGQRLRHLADYLSESPLDRRMLKKPSNTLARCLSS